MRKDTARRQQILLMILSAILLLFLLASSACPIEPLTSITIQNKTEQNLTIFIWDANFGDIPPGGESKNRVTIERRYSIEAKNAQGETVYKREITFEAMEDMDWTVAIPPPPE